MTLYAHVASTQGMAGLESMFVQIEQDGRTWEFDAGDFRSTSSNHNPHTETIELDSRKSFSVVAGLADHADTFALASQMFEPMDEFRWFVGVGRDTIDPRGGCFSCIGSLSVPIPEERALRPNERFWLTWGGTEFGAENF